MTYCVNPACQNPQNPPNIQTCLSCGSHLLLKERYHTIQLLGEGGMERTFLAVDQQNQDSYCIIKQLLPVETGLEASVHSSTLEKAIEVFHHDAQRRQAMGDHPQIAKLLDHFEQDKRLYMAIEFIDGQSLLEEMEQHGAFREPQIWELLDHLLPVFKTIHDRNIIHRDIKPDNIRRRHNRQLVLTNLGISKHLASLGLARTGSTIGTEGYAPPEQIRGGLAYPASDLYSLGVTCIQLLTGEWVDDLYDPLEGRWIWRERLWKIGSDVSDGLAQILEKLLQDRVNERYQSVTEVLEDLPSRRPTFLNSLEEESLPPTVPSVTPPATPPLADPHAWRCIRTLKGHQGWVWAISFSPDGSTLASGSADQSVVLWNMTTGDRLRTLEGHSDLVLSVAFSPQSPLLASSSRDKSIILWNAETGEKIRNLGGWFSGHSELVDALAFSPDGTMLASGSWDRKIILWNPYTGKAFRKLRGHSSWVYSIAFSPDGITLASGSRDTTLMLWNVHTGKHFFTLYGDSGLVNAVAFSPDGQTIVSGNFDGSLVLWDVGRGEQITRLPGHSERINAIAFSPDGKLLASGSRDQTVILWDIRKRQRICTLTDHSDRVFAVTFSPDSKTLATAAGDETVKLWQAP